MICGLGNALVDAIVRIEDDETLDRMDLRRGTMHLVDDAAWRAAFARVEQLGAEILPGGSCANAIVTAAILGGDTDLCANVGDDRFGRIYVDRLSETVGEHHVNLGRGMATGKCLSLISPDAERTMLTDLGCAMDLPPESLFRQTLRGADLFHLTGYLFTGGPIAAVADEALAIARESDTRISFDLADPWVIEAHRERLEPVAALADVLFLNDAEAAIWTGTPDPHAAAEALASRPGLTVVKMGAQGSLVVGDGQTWEVPAETVKAVDTTGAGDAYAGGFLFGLARGFDPGHSGRIASRIGAATVARIGGVLQDADEARRLVADLL